MNATDLSSALAGSKVNETQAAGGNGDFLKMDFDTGEWLLGQENDIVTGDEILVNTPTFSHGWILWSGGRPKKVMTSFVNDLPEAPPAIKTVNKRGEEEWDEPSEARSMQAALVDDATPIMFDTNSYGGRKGMDVLLGKIKAHAAEGSQFLYPKVKLANESYPGTGKRSGKTNHNPVFELVAWCDVDGNEEGGKAAAVEDKTDEVEEDAPEEQAEAPTRQRRKRKSAA
tara:strand:- start:9135 stop:9818 length:684 start_codon:yes stop_codon:yes gene_type:complete